MCARSHGDLSEELNAMTITQVDAFEAMLQHHRTLVEDVDSRIAVIAEAVGRGMPDGPAVGALITYLAEEVLPHALAEEDSIYRAAGTRADLADTVNGMIAEHRVPGDHPVHRIGEVRASSSSTVNGVFLCQSVREYLLRKVGNECANRRSIRHTTAHGLGDDGNPAIDVFNQRAVVLQHRFEGVDLGDCHGIQLLAQIAVRSGTHRGSRRHIFLG